jgi:ferredoxin
VKVRINSELCQGHGRCYAVASELFGDDDDGYGIVLRGGLVPPGQEGQARLAESNCPERAIAVIENE